MKNKQLNSLSIEDLSAYLDGNLTPSDMQLVSSIIENSPALKEQMSIIDLVDKEISQNQDLVDIDVPLDDIHLPSDASFADITQSDYDNILDVLWSDNILSTDSSWENLEQTDEDGFDGDDFVIDNSNIDDNIL